MVDVVKELSAQLAGVVERAGASVVRVEGRRRGPASGVVWSADGLIVTTSHVIEWDEGIEVGLAGGAAVAATLVGRDPATDVAVLKAAAGDLAPPSWTDAPGLRVGHLVLGLSRPGRSARASLGIVSAVGESWRTRTGGRVDRYVQADLALHPGFSGSLLVDVEGGAVGLNTSGLIRGACLALPLATLRRVVGTLVAHGHIRRGFLGVGTYPVRLPAALEAKAGQSTALIVVSVQPESPAERAGLVLGDALVSLDGHPTRHPGDLIPLLEEERFGATVTARLLRAGEVLEVPITIGVRGAREQPPA
jgi:S1-C subfamily serine protease